MLDGFRHGAGGGNGVIVGQNWGSLEEDQQQQQELSHHQASKRIKMVDMIQASHHHQRRMEMQIPKLYGSIFDQGSSTGYFDHTSSSWRLNPGGGAAAEPAAAQQLVTGNNFLQRSFHHHHQQAQQQAEEEEELQSVRSSTTETEPDLKDFFAAGSHLGEPSSRSKPSSLNGKLKQNMLIDEDGESLLTLRPPNSSRSDITNVSDTSSVHNKSSSTPAGELKLSRLGSSSPFHNHHQQQNHQPLGMELLDKLLKCAEAVDQEDLDSALGLLSQLKQGASVYGDSMQRLTAHFSEGLATRILRSSSSSSLNNLHIDFLRGFILHKHRRDDYLGAFSALYTVSPYFKLAHFTANQAILESFHGHDSVHVIDLQILQGFQWPSFIQALASRSQGPPSLLRLTGIGSDPDALRETGARLSSFAAMFGVPFRFQGVVAGDLEEIVDLEKRFELREGEALAVNAVFQLHRMLNRGTESLKLERFLARVQRLRPLVFTIVEQEAGHNSPSFIARFMEALHYYAAVFDSLDASLPQRNEERVLIEQVMFAREIRNIVSCEGEERVERHEKLGFWSAKMIQSGFVQVPMSSHSVSQAKLLLQLCPCEGYRLVESPSDSWPVGSISLGWQDRLLLTASSWTCENPQLLG